MVFRGVFLLVSRFMFFIDDNEPGIFDGRKDGGSCSNDDASFTRSNAMPFVETLTLREIGVKNGDLIV